MQRWKGMKLTKRKWRKVLRQEKKKKKKEAITHRKANDQFLRHQLSDLLVVGVVPLHEARVDSVEAAEDKPPA